MKHLTAQEILQIVDGTMANGEKTKSLLHLESCPHCRREVEFTRSMERVARSVPLTRPSAELTSRVMKQVVPQSKSSLGNWFINNMANVLAMALVLSVIWFAVSVKSPEGTRKGPSIVTNALSVYGEYYAKAREFLSSHQQKTVQKPLGEQSAETNKIILFTIVSVLILVIVDRFIGRKLLRLRN